MIVAGITPEQAIDGELGAEDTFTREDVESAFVSGYSLGLDMFDFSKPDTEKGWNQNERDLDEEMLERGWVRKGDYVGKMASELAKLRELMRDIWQFTGMACKKYPKLFDQAAQGGQSVQPNAINAFEQRLREMGVIE